MFDGLHLEDLEQVNEAFPSQLIVILYDEAIKGMTDAIDAIGRGDIETRFAATTRTAEIVSQLYLALDMEQGGEIAENLGGIYNFILTQMPQINFRNDIRMAEQVVTLLAPIRDSWFELDERIRSAVTDAEAEADRIAAATVAHGALAGKRGA
jgi:flagellar protein FliS